MRLPVDQADSNWLPDAGWRAGSGASISGFGLASSDDETGPTGNSFTGDGLTAFEEYRGFAASGQHVRLNPQEKDLFIRSELPEGLGYAANLPLRVWGIVSGETNLTRDINANYTNNGFGGDIPAHFNQRALVVSDGGHSGTGVLGLTTTSTNAPAPPSMVTAPILVYTQTIRLTSPTTNDLTTPDAVDPPKTSQTIGHEVGHGITINHVDAAQACPVPAPVFSVMLTNYFSQTATMTCAWSNIPTGYSAADVSAIRLR